MGQESEKQQPFIKIRWLVCAISCTTVFSLIACRSCLNLAVVAMTDPGNETEIIEDANGTQVTIHRLTNQHFINWTQSTNDQILQAAFIGAVISPIPSGRIAEIFGPRKVASVLSLIAGLVTLVFPYLAERSFEGCFGVRIITGFCVGCAFPCTHVLVSRWATKYEKTIFASLLTAGGILANACIGPLVAWLSGQSYFGGWPAVFYVIGGITVVSALLVLLIVYDYPENHPFISDAEKEDILANRPPIATNNSGPMPWGAIITSAPVWALIISNFALGWLEALISGQIPAFYANVVGLSIETNGLVSSLPFIVAIISSLFFSYVSDKLRENGRYSTSALRKFFADIGFIVSSAFLVSTTWAKKNTVLTVTLIIACKAFSVAQVAGCYIMHLDISPTYAGSLVGLMETSQNCASVAMNQVAALIIGDEETYSAWSNFFLITAGLCIFGTHYFALLGSSKLQPWDPTYKTEEEALEEDLNGEDVVQTIYDPDIIIRDSRRNTIISEFPAIRSRTNSRYQPNQTDLPNNV